MRLRRFKSVLCLFLIALMLSVSCLPVRADSNSLTSIYINLMNKSNLSGIQDIQTMSSSDLRVLSLFLSNYYVPYKTSLNEPEAMQANKEFAKTSLEQLGFDKDAADQLIDNVFNYSLSTLSDLYIKLDGTGDASKATWGYGMRPSGHEVGLGVGIQPSRVDKSSNPDLFEKLFPYEDKSYMILSEGVFNSIVFGKVWYNNTNPAYTLGWTPLSLDGYSFEIGTIQDGKFNSVGIIDKNFVQIYRSMYSRFVRNSGSTKGEYGNSFFNTTSDDASSSSSADDLIDTVLSQDYAGSSKEFIELTQWAFPMKTDWVGNLCSIINGNALIVMPSCINPFVFSHISTASRNDLNLISSLGICSIDSAVSNTSVKFEYKIARGFSYRFTSDSIHTFGFNSGKAGDLANKLSEIGFLVCEGGSDEISPINIDTGLGDLKFKENVSKTHCSLLDFTSLSNITTSGSDTINSIDVITESGLSDKVKTKFSSGSVTTTNSGSGGSEFSSRLNISQSDNDIMRNILLTYVYAYANRNETTYDQAKCQVDMKFNDVFPTVENQITWVVNSTDTKSEEVLSMVYYFLHPTEGLSYFATWIKNKISAMIVGWHEDIVGNTDSNSTTGMTQYLGMTGYATVPTLSDISWVSFLLDNYQTIVVWLVMLIVIVLVCYVLTGDMTPLRAIIGVALFSFLALIPPFAINTVVNLINNASESIYSEKFNYWAVTQTKTYVDSVSTTTSSNQGESDEFLTSLLATSAATQGDNSEGFYSGVRVKWMTPKRNNEFLGMHDRLANSLEGAGFNSIISILTNAGKAAAQDEEFLSDTNLTYLYRDYLDIYKYGSVTGNVALYVDSSNSDKRVSENNGDVYNMYDSSYNDIVWRWYSDTSYGATGSAITYSSGLRFGEMVNVANLTNVSNALNDLDSNTYMDLGFLPSVNNNPTEGYISLNSHRNVYYLLRARNAVASLQNAKKFVAENYRNGLDISRTTLYGKYLGDYNLGIGYLAAGTLQSGGETKADDLNDESLGSMFFSMYSESPYYYFSYWLRDVLNSQGYMYSKTRPSSSTGMMKDLLLSDKQSFFYNLEDASGDGYGELRDFTNMHDFFYFVLPILQLGVDAVDEFDDYYGMYMYDDVSLSWQHNSGTFIYDGVTYNDDSAGWAKCKNAVFGSGEYTDEQKYKLWHNFNVMTLFNIYTTWLDTMEDCGYADAETIQIAGTKYLVENPLDPTSYFKLDSTGMTIAEGRPMIFSRSEMRYYGLTEADLTGVEQNIIKFQDAVYKDAIDLMNYYTFDDETLLHSLAMIMTFDFNKSFSETNLIGSDYVMYPQNYELKAFTYDAYLRQIVANSSGDSLMSQNIDGTNESIYRRVLKKTSISFGIVLLANDAVATYAIPALRLFFLILIFVMSVLMITSAALGIPKDNGMSMIGVVWKSLLQPLVAFLLTSVAFAWLISLFMGTGANNVVSSDLNISLGDPTMALLVILVLNCLVLWLYFKIVKQCFKDMKGYLQSVVNSISGAVTGALKTVVNTVSNPYRTYGRKMVHNVKKAGMMNNPGKTDTSSRFSLSRAGVTGAVFGAAGALGKRVTDKVTSGRLSEDDKKKSYDAKSKRVVGGLGGLTEKAEGSAEKAKASASKAREAQQAKLAGNNQQGMNKRGAKASFAFQKERASAARGAVKDNLNYFKQAKGFDKLFAAKDIVTSAGTAVKENVKIASSAVKMGGQIAKENTIGNVQRGIRTAKAGYASMRSGAASRRAEYDRKKADDKRSVILGRNTGFKAGDTTEEKRIKPNAARQARAEAHSTMKSEKQKGYMAEQNKKREAAGADYDRQIREERVRRKLENQKGSQSPADVERRKKERQQLIANNTAANQQRRDEILAQRAERERWKANASNRRVERVGNVISFGGDSGDSGAALAEEA